MSTRCPSATGFRRNASSNMRKESREPARKKREMPQKMAKTVREGQETIDEIRLGRFHFSVPSAKKKGFKGISRGLEVPIGIGVLVTGDPQVSWALSGRLLGALLVFGAVISAALYMVCVRNLGRERSAMEITGMQFIYGTLLFVPAFFLELPGMQWSQVSPRSLLALAFLVLFATLGGFLCYNHALTRIQASRAAVFINGIPVVTAFGAWAMLGETLTPLQISGGLLVLFGVYMANRPGDRPDIGHDIG